MSGDKPFKTPFGTFYPPNITPDKETGIGSWTLAQFSEALSNGNGPQGNLYPVFPYNSFRLMNDQEIADLYAAVMAVPPASHEAPANRLIFPFNIRLLVSGWKNLFFSPHRYRNDPSHSARWNRGAYLANGPAHCVACHSPLNAFGAVVQGAHFTGNPVSGPGGKAPPLTPAALLQDGYTRDGLAQTLKTGITPNAGKVGNEMGLVVTDETSHCTGIATAREQTRRIVVSPAPNIQTERGQADMKTRLLLATLATATAMALAVPAFAADSAQDFVDKAAVGGMFEVQTSKIAQDKAHDQSVKDFAAMMIHDHEAANAKLESIAGEQKLKVPDSLDAAHQSDLEKLQNEKDPFDPSYVKMQRDAHADAVKLFESYAKDGDNAELKTFAEETAPTLKMHQDKIEKIATAMEGKPAASDGTPAVTTTDTPDASAPVPGANSFTEAQAKSRIEEAGYSDVSALAKDDKGIWRGQANKDGKSVSVALDFQGNVVAGTE